ncbi:MAG: HAD family hydrolase [Desulfovibrio sp.]|jgi:phosphoglycolate phosphatase-like HAD superfamily hydrolase|nr:HAD family hydrolase [Desulfovibrio sp.]
MTGVLKSPPDFAGEEASGRLHGLVFDIDGVMLDSRTSNMEFYNLIRRAVQLPPLTRGEEDYCQMATVEESLAHIIPAEYGDAAKEACARINYEEQILPLLSLEPGLLEVLHWLQLWQVRLAIFTNRSSTVEELLRYFGLESFFDPVMTASACPPKPDPAGLLTILDHWGLAPDDIAFLGDSRVDAMAAKAADVPFWAFRNQSLAARLHVDGFFKLISWITPLVEGR